MEGKIPRVQGRDVELSTKSTGVPIDPERASQQGKNAQVMGSALQVAGETLSKAYTLAEQTKAENFLEKQFSSIEANAENDQDISSGRQKYYHDELNKTTKDATGMLTLPAAKGLFEAAADRRREMSRIRVDGIFTKKAIDAGKAELATYLETARDRFIQAPTPQYRQLAINERDAKINDMAAVGYIPREAAAELKVRLHKDWNEAQVSHDIETNPAFAAQELAKGENGFYKEVAPDIREKALDRATRRVDYLHTKAREDTEDAIMRADATKTLLPDQVEEAALTGLISKSFYNVMKKKFLSNIGPQAETDKPTYMRLVNMLLNPATKASDARVALVDAQADGKLSVEDFKSLYQMHLTPSAAGGMESMGDQMGGEQTKSDFEKAVAQDTLKKRNLVKKQSDLRSAISILQNIAGKNIANAAEMVQDFIAHASQKKPAEYQAEARKVLSREMLRARPEIAHYPKEGRVLIDSTGNRVRVYPDGSYEEVK